VGLGHAQLAVERRQRRTGSQAFAILKLALASNSYDPTVSPASQQAAIQV
jgi:hypothetical protein